MNGGVNNHAARGRYSPPRSWSSPFVDKIHHDRLPVAERGLSASCAIVEIESLCIEVMHLNQAIKYVLNVPTS